MNKTDNDSYRHQNPPRLIAQGAFALAPWLVLLIFAIFGWTAWTISLFPWLLMISFAGQLIGGTSGLIGELKRRAKGLKLSPLLIVLAVFNIIAAPILAILTLLIMMSLGDPAPKV